MFYNLKDKNINVNNILKLEIKEIQKNCEEYIKRIKIKEYNIDTDNSNSILLPRTFFDYSPIETKISFGFDTDVYEYLYQQNMYIYLGIEPDPYNHFNCIMCDDKDKSSAIFRHKDNGMYLYKCKRCNFRVGDIKKVTECLTNLNRPDALQFLMDVYGITLDKTEDQIKQEIIIEANIKFLMNRENIKVNYPVLYNRIKFYIPQLIVLHEFAKINLTLEQAINSNLITFTAPIKEISKELIKNERNGDVKQIAKRNNILVFIGLLMKLSDDEILPLPLQNLKEYSMSKGYYNYATVYAIPSYNYNTLNIAENKSKEWKESGMTVRGFGREMIDKGFGKEKILEVFPRLKDNSHNPLNNEIADMIKEKIYEAMKTDEYIIEKSIFNNGYFIRDIKRELYYFNDTPDIHTVKITKKLVHTVYKVYLPELLNLYEFKRSKLTKKLRERFNILDNLKGYPTILYWDKQI